MAKKVKALLGRPPKLSDDDKTLHTIRELGKLACTQIEAAGFLGVHRDTLGDFLRTSKKALEAWENGLQVAKVSLKRAQMQAALSGNVTMQIWLGKQLLGQRDQLATENTHKVDVNLDAVRDAIASRFDRIEAAR